MSDQVAQRRWETPGPVSTAFLENDAQVSLLIGPVGSGKTTTGLMRGIFCSYRQPPEPDGVRRVKGAVVRSAYVDLWRTTIPSWWGWFPQTLGSWVGGNGGPATHSLVLTHPKDGGRIELAVEFIGLNKLRVEEALRGWEGTWAYCDEVDLLEPEALPWLLQRCGRFRLNVLTELPWKAVWGTCNPTDIDHWIFERYVTAPPSEIVKGRPVRAVYRQPSGLSPGAENRAKFGEDRYREITATMAPWDVRRFVHGEFAMSRDGDPVFPEFNDQTHVAREPLVALPGRKLILGLDAGGTPACTIWQRAADGQWRGLEELVADEGQITGPNRFGELLAQFLAERFPQLPASMIDAYGDPSAADGADRTAGEASWLEAVGNKLGIRIRPAQTNAWTPRWEACRLPMTRLIDGVKPGLVLSPRMRKLRKAWGGAYRFRKRAGGGREDRPDKNEASHVADSAQYALLGGGEWAEVTGRREARGRQFQAASAVTDFAVF